MNNNTNWPEIVCINCETKGATKIKFLDFRIWCLHVNITRIHMVHLYRLSSCNLNIYGCQKQNETRRNSYKIQSIAKMMKKLKKKAQFSTVKIVPCYTDWCPSNHTQHFSIEHSILLLIYTVQCDWGYVYAFRKRNPTERVPTLKLPLRKSYARERIAQTNWEKWTNVVVIYEFVVFCVRLSDFQSVLRIY